MSSKIVSRRERDFKENPEFLSPPVIVEPLYQCAISVTIISYVPNADIDVEVDGVVVVSVAGGYPWPQGITVLLPNELIAGQVVRAMQKTATAKSDWSDPAVVRDHTKEFPAGPPRPVINPAPIYECGVRTGVGNLLGGGNVWITADMVEVGRVNGCSPQQGVNVNPAYSLSQKVRAWYELCKDPSPPSIEYLTQVPPSPLPTPTFDPMYEGSQQITVQNIVNGALITFYRGGANLGTWPCWGGSFTVNGISPIVSGETFTASQTMCPGNPSSPPGSGTVQPCSSLPAPQIGPLQAGDNRVVLTQFVPDAVIKVYLNGIMVGASGGPIVVLSKEISRGDVVDVIQDLNGCESNYALEINVVCIDPPVAPNPAGLNLFPIGWQHYNKGPINGTVYYPAEDDGEGQPFYKRLHDLGRVPIVFMAHGNHNPSDPSYLGYDYFQQDLAKMGVIAVSIDCNALNGAASGVQNIEDRADLIIDHIAFFQGLDADPASTFFGSVDFSRVGLMGHSRGGDAVVTVPTVIALVGVYIRSVLALAPTNFRFWFGLSTIQPKDYTFMTILPAGDGDVRDNNGAQFYDQAIPGPFKSQVYTHFANHNFFNRQWLNDDSLAFPQPPVMARFDHEHVLSAYGCALYRFTLLGHDTKSYLTNHKIPSGVLTSNIHLAFEQAEVITVDNHEDGNTINFNSLGQPTQQLAGMSADEFRFVEGAVGTFNSSFHGQTTGMVVRAGKPGRIFYSSLGSPIDINKSEIWIRAAEVTDSFTVPAGATGFELGLEDQNGTQSWIDSDDIGGLPRPYLRNAGMIKTMLKTLRFDTACFQEVEKIDLSAVQAILIRCNRSDERAIAFDDLQIIRS